MATRCVFCDTAKPLPMGRVSLSSPRLDELDDELPEDEPLLDSELKRDEIELLPDEPVSLLVDGVGVGEASLAARLAAEELGDPEAPVLPDVLLPTFVISMFRRIGAAFC